MGISAQLVICLSLAALPAPGEVSADLAGYERRAAPLLARYCADCHGAEEPEGNLNLEGVNPNLLRGGDLETWRMIEEQIRYGDMPPKGAEPLSAAERESLLGWIVGELRKTQLPGVVSEEKLALPEFGNYVDHAFLFGERLPRVYPAPPRLWRLRPQIYHALAPRLGERVSGLSNALSSFDGSEFKDYSAPYFLDEASTRQLLANAKKIAEAQLGPSSKDRALRALAEGDSPPGPEQLEEAIEVAVRKALGRSPREEETARYRAFHARALEAGGTLAAAQALLTAVLMHPEFLFRQELGDGAPDEYGRVRLTQRETAYALSYALADQPLAEFLHPASRGELGTREEIAEAVRGRLEDPSPLFDRNPRILEFFREYFHYPFATDVFKDAPAGGEHRAEALVGDLELTIKDVLQRDRRVLAELLTTRRYHVDTTYGRKQQADQYVKRVEHSRKYQTAYSLPLDWRWSPHLQPVEFPAEERAGVLTHPAWLAAWSGNFENHPVQRGKWIRTHLLGGTVPDVPIGVDARVPEQEHATFRERLLSATSAAECRRCHRKMDPLGLPFERYDHYGRVQRLDAGRPVDTRGEISRTVAELHGPVSGPAEMMERLAGSEHVEQVFTRYAFRFFLGRNETLGDANTLQDAHRAYRESDGSFRALVVSLLTSDSFLLRQSPAEEPSAAAASAR